MAATAQPPGNAVAGVLPGALAGSGLAGSGSAGPGLAGTRVLVTGAARGLGEAFARALVAAGARVVLGDVLHERGQALVAELLASQVADQASQEASGAASQSLPCAHYLPMDMADPAAVATGVAQAAQWLGGLDGLVNNAAITHSGGKAMADIAVDTWDAVMAVNVRGPWLATVAAHPHLKASGQGRVVNLASDTALWGAPRLMAYVASKGAVISMTRSMARELGPDGITVNAIAPGLTLVEATQYVPQERHDFYARGRAISRAQIPSDLSAALLFLLSPASGFVTGQVLPVNGGFVMG